MRARILKRARCSGLKRGGRLCHLRLDIGRVHRHEPDDVVPTATEAVYSSAAAWKTWPTLPCRRWARSHPVIDTEVGFDDIDRAPERMESRQIFGKIIPKMD